MPRLRAVALLLVATSIWGATFLVVKCGLSGTAPMTFLAVLLRPGTTPLATGDWLTLGCAAAFACHGVLLQTAVRHEMPATVTDRGEGPHVSTASNGCAQSRLVLARRSSCSHQPFYPQEVAHFSAAVRGGYAGGLDKLQPMT